MSKRAPVVYRQLNEEERDELLQGLALAAKMAGASPPLTMDHVQALFDAAIRERLQDDAKLTAIGFAFGQQIVTQTGLDWVRVLAEWGEETVVAPHGKSISCLPISMIKEKIATKKATDLASFAASLAESIESLRDEGEIRNWKPF